MSARGTSGMSGGNEDWVERVRVASDIVEIVGQTVKLKRSGRNWVGLCPFHKEKTPSFSVHAERQFYHCFSCNAGGDVFKFVMEIDKVGFLEAVELLSRRANISIPERRRDGGATGQRAGLLEALDAAASAYSQWLGDPERGAATRAYLERRGITRESQQTFRLGLAPPGWENLVQRLRPKVAEEVLVQAGLAARRDTGRGLYDRFRNRLMVPLVTPGGAVVGFGARALADEDNPKYLNSPETPVYHKSQYLYGLDAARRAVEPDGEVIVVEGYFDTIALHQAGMANTVATSGTALTADQARLLKRLAPRVALTYDGDDAGQEAMMRSLGALLAEGLEVAVVDLPSGVDPDTLVREGGRSAWDAARHAAADPVEFVQRHVLRRGGPGDPRERALQAIVRLGVDVQDPIRLRLLLERAGQVFGLEARVIQRAVALKRTGQASDAPVQSAVRERRRSEAYLEHKTLALLLRYPETRERVSDRISPEDFRDPEARELADAVWQEADLPSEGEAGRLARELLAGDLTVEDPVSELEQAARLLLERRLRQRKREIEQELRHAGGGPDELRLLQEIQMIGDSLRNLSG